MPLSDSRPVTVHQTRQQDLIQAGRELVLEDRPEIRFLKIGVHSRKRTWHGFLPPSSAAVS